MPEYEVNSMDQLQARVRTWTYRTFHRATRVTAASHLLSEATELFVALGGKPNDAIKIVAAALVKEPGDAHIEVSDVAILALDIAGRTGLNLYDGVVSKMDRNEARAWGKANALGFFEHTSEPEQEATDGGQPEPATVE